MAYYIYEKTNTKKLIKNKPVEITTFKPRNKSYKTLKSLEKDLDKLKPKKNTEYVKCNIPNKLTVGDKILNHLGNYHSEVIEETESFYYIRKSNNKEYMLLKSNIKNKIELGCQGSKLGLLIELIE